MERDFNILLQKLNRFIRKYYKNQMIKGVILSLSIVLVLFLVVDAVEYVAWTGTLARTVIFYTFLAVVSAVIIGYIIIPALKLLRIGKTITHRQAARIIGEFFPDVSDKLLNTIELHESMINGEYGKEFSLLEASIEQKAANLKPVPFRKAIDIKGNLRYLRYFVPPLLLLLAILIISPGFITDPSKRIVNHSVHFEKPIPYKLSLTNERLEALQHDNFTLQVEVTGEEIPASIQVKIGNYNYRMQEVKPGLYNYTLKDLNSDVYFNLVTHDFSSEQFHLKVYPKPVIYNFDIEVDYPDYLQRKNDLIENSGDISVPEGSLLTWNFYTKDAESVQFNNGEEKKVLSETESNVYRYRETASRNFYYSVMAANKHVPDGDSMNFSVQIIKDEYPAITVEERKEESLYGFAHYDGIISDDHGFRSLRFHYQKDLDSETWQSENIAVDQTLNRQYFNYTIQLNDFGLAPGEGMRYYFEVRDNDAVNGYKRTKTPVFQLSLPDLAQVEENREETSDQIKESMRKAMEDLERINREIEEARMSLIEKKDLDWLDKKQLAELFQKQEKLQEQLSKLEQMNQEINQMEELLDQQEDEALKEKWDELQEMMEELADEDLEKQLEEIQKQLEDINKDDLARQLDNIKKNNEALKNNLEQNLELYKQLEFEKKINEISAKLEELAEEQQELARQTDEKEIKEEESLESQQKNEESFTDIEKELEKAQELNSQLEDPFDVEADPELSEEIHQDMEKAAGDLQKGKQQKAAKSQRSAGQKMEKMASQLNMMMQGAMQNRMAEDAEMIKRMLDNLLDLSFSTESLMDRVENTSQNDPAYIDNIDQLKQLQDDFSIVHDSLIALSKRQIMVKPFIVKESDKVISYMERSLQSLQDRRIGKSLGEQQYAMTSQNNLALMLDESLDQMQMSLAMSGSGQGQQCPNPGQGEPQSMEQMSEMQKQLNQGMQQGMENEGQSGENGLNSDSEQLARMAEAQSEIRRQLQEYLEEMESQGGSGNALNKLIEEMQKTEEDIINRRITQETLERQKQIEVRLLQSEKAEQEREKEKKRESTVGKDRKRSNLTDVLEYNESEMANEEILIAEPIEMAPYYRELLKRYLYNLQKENAQ